MFKIARTKKLKPSDEVRIHQGKRQARLRIDGKHIWVDLNAKGNAVIESPYWHARIDGVLHRLTRDRVSAETKLLKLRTTAERVATGIQLPEPKGGGKLSELIEQYVGNLKRQGCRPSTTNRKPRDLMRMLAELAVRDLAGLRRLTVADFDKWAHTSKLAPRSCHTLIQGLRSFLIWLQRSGFIANVAAMPGKRGLAARPKGELSVEEEKKLMTATTWKRSIIYRLMLSTGCRAGATGSLLVGDLDFDRVNGPVMTLRAESAKTKRGLLVPIPMALVNDLKKIIKGKAASDPAFGILGNSLSRAFRQDLDKAGIPRTRPDGTILCLHCLRHTFASRALRSGASPAIVAKVGGWASLAVLMSVYSHLLPEDGRGLVDQIAGN